MTGSAEAAVGLLSLARSILSPLPARDLSDLERCLSREADTKLKIRVQRLIESPEATFRKSAAALPGFGGWQCRTQSLN
jgi:hypothetical protein